VNIRSTRALWGALLLALFAGSAARAQSLGEVAAKEQQRREQERQKHGTSKVITSDDLHGAGRGTFSNAGSTSAEGEPAKGEGKDAAKDGAAAPAKDKEKTDDEQRAERQAAWRKRVQDTQTQVDALATRVASLQNSMNDVNGLYSPGRAELAGQFEKAKADLAAAQQQAADLQEEGRRNGFR